MQRGAFAELLELLNSPLVPVTVCVDAIDPDIGIDECSGAAVVARETSGGHGVQGLERPLRRGGNS